MSRHSQAQPQTRPTEPVSHVTPKWWSDNNSLWRQFFVACVGGVIAAATALLAFTLTVTQQEISFKNEKYFGVQKDMLDKRFTLMERFVQISQKNIILESLDMNEQLHLYDLAKSVKRRSAEDATSKITAGIPATEKCSALKSEYITVVTMSRAIFGPKTRKALDALTNASNPKIWKADQKYVDSVVLAMSSELTYGLSSIPLSTSPDI